MEREKAPRARLLATPRPAPEPLTFVCQASAALSSQPMLDLSRAKERSPEDSDLLDRVNQVMFL